MRRFYRIDFDPEDEGAWELDIDWMDSESQQGDMCAFNRCETYEGAVPVRMHVARGGHTCDFNRVPINIPCISQNFADVLQLYCGDDVQLVPVMVGEMPGYHVLNVLTTLACVDFQLSILDSSVDEGTGNRSIKAAKKLRIVESEARGHHVFRLAEWLMPLIISETLLKALRNKRMSGFAVTAV